MKTKLFSYNLLDTYIHRLSGLTKLICFLCLTFSVMFSYDIRINIGILIFSAFLFKVSKIKFSQVKVMMIYVFVFLITNVILSFIFSPEEGVQIYGTRHELFHLVGPFSMTIEELFYLTTKFFKYASVVPLGIIFLLTTNPSEFAAALSGVGVSYKASYAVALTLRYFPDIQREYHDISLSQQARGLEMSSKAKLWDRFKNSLLIVVPLIFSTLDRIENISNAMDLRGFGKKKKRTWFNKKNLTKDDYLAIAVSAAIFIGTILITIFVNKGRFYNPFI